MGKVEKWQIRPISVLACMSNFKKRRLLDIDNNSPVGGGPRGVVGQLNHGKVMTVMAKSWQSQPSCSWNKGH